MSDFEVMRAEEEWQRAGAYSVRIEGMIRQHHIPYRTEIDERDGEGTRYIVLLDDGYPVATCRFFELGEVPADSVYAGYEGLVMLGRVVVLPEYRGRGLGAKTVIEAEKWIRELGYRYIGIDSRVTAVGFYEKLGYTVTGSEVYISEPFECIYVIKDLTK